MKRRLSSRPLPLLTLSDFVPPPDPGYLRFLNNSNPFIRLIRNYLVVEHLAEYLRLKDLKTVSLVSKDCHNCFINTDSYYYKVIMGVVDDSDKYESDCDKHGYWASSVLDPSYTNINMEDYGDTWDYFLEYDDLYGEDEVMTMSNNKLLDLLQPGRYPPREFFDFSTPKEYSKLYFVSCKPKTERVCEVPTRESDEIENLATSAYILQRTTVIYKQICIKAGVPFSVTDLIYEMEDCYRTVESILSDPSILAYMYNELHDKLDKLHDSIYDRTKQLENEMFWDENISCRFNSGLKFKTPKHRKLKFRKCNRTQAVHPHDGKTHILIQNNDL